MATDDLIRASDADRDAVVTVLREAYTAGRLMLDEFDERMSAAYAARTWGDLRALTVDLPVQPVLGADVPARKTAAAQLPSQPHLPGQEPELEPQTLQDPQEPEVRRKGSPIGLLIPVAIWMLLVSHGTIAPGIVFLFIVVCALVSIAASIRRR